MVKICRKPVPLAALWVSTNEKLNDFYTSSWQPGESPVPMLIVRMVLFSCAMAIFTWSIIESSPNHWMIYLTNWGVLLVTATMMSSVIVSIYAVCKKPFETTELPWYISLYWLLFNVTVTLSVMITALYWLLLYNPAEKEESRGFTLDIATHGLTTCIMGAELLISRTPVRLAHIYQPVSIGVWYSAFSAIYYAAGGTDPNGNRFIYELLDWQHGRRALTVVMGSIVGETITYLLVWTAAFCRDKLSMGLVRTTSLDLLARSNPLDSPGYV